MRTHDAQLKKTVQKKMRLKFCKKMETEGDYHGQKGVSLKKFKF